MAEMYWVWIGTTRVQMRQWSYFPRALKVRWTFAQRDLSEFKGKATYEQIKAYVLEKTGLKVSSLYIAQIKKKCGLDVGENLNRSKSENAYLSYLLLLILVSPYPRRNTINIFKSTGKMKLIFVSDSRADICNG